MSQATDFVELISNQQFDEAYALGGDALKNARTLETFKQDMIDAQLAWPERLSGKTKRAISGNGGYKLMGEFTLAGERATISSLCICTLREMNTFLGREGKLLLL